MLGRTPASISFHLGNASHLFHPDQGLENVGSVFRRVWQNYRDDEIGLQREAKRLRHELFNGLESPRLERELSDGESAAMQRELERRFPEARLPPGAVIIYSYRGSEWLCVLAPLRTALAYPRETAELLRITLEVLGSAVRRNPAAKDALDGRTVELAERAIGKWAPSLRYSDLAPMDRVRLAMRIPGLKSMRRWHPRAERLNFYATADLAVERERIRAYFGIDPANLTIRSVHLLLDALDEALTAGRL